MSPVRPTAHPPAAPDPFAPPYPGKSVTLPRHPFPALPHPTPRTSHQSPRLRHFSPPVRPNPAFSPSLLNNTHSRATLAHARDRPPRPAARATVGAVREPPVRGLTRVSGSEGTAECPCSVSLSYSATRRHFRVPKTRSGITDWRGTGDTPSYENNRMQQKRTDFAFPRSLSPWKHALSLPNGRGAGTTVLGAPSDLKQAHRVT